MVKLCDVVIKKRNTTKTASNSGCAVKNGDCMVYGTCWFACNWYHYHKVFSSKTWLLSCMGFCTNKLLNIGVSFYSCLIV